MRALSPRKAPGWWRHAAAWDAAFREYGIVYVTGHGVPDAATSELASSATTFFSQSADAKMAHCLHQGYGKGGFPAWGIPPGGTLNFTLECLKVE